MKKATPKSQSQIASIRCKVNKIAFEATGDEQEVLQKFREWLDQIFPARPVEPQPGKPKGGAA